MQSGRALFFFWSFLQPRGTYPLTLNNKVMPDVMRKNHTSDGTRITALPFHAQRAHPITLAVPDMPVFPGVELHGDLRPVFFVVRLLDGFSRPPVR